MSNPTIAKVQAAYLKKDLPRIDVGDTVDVHTRIVEGEKERIQIFSGVIIGKKGGGISQTVTVRRMVANEGVERTFPLHSPKVAKIEVLRHGRTRRAKLFFLRDRVGKSQRLRERRRGLGDVVAQVPPQSDNTPAAAPQA